MAKSLIWLSFDLGIQGDYESLYEWLDEHKARECGDGLACFSYEYEGDLVRSLTSELTGKVDLKPRNRVYVIWVSEGVIRGRFIHGKRRNAVWQGFTTFASGEDSASG